jgi:NAD(P)-dependent dehydrogenase (short-subunit alcohol dehydrogenase family)
VFITGAAGGIGAATAQRMCEAGAAVVLADLDGDGVEAIAAGLAGAGHAAHSLPLDVTADGSVALAVDAAAELLGGLDTVVANAGVLTVAPLDELSLLSFRRTLDVNLVGTFSTVRHALRHLREAEGPAIVCTASQAGIEGAPELSAYCASKFGVVGLVQSLARELGPEGIRVSAVAPGLVDTEMLNEFFSRRADSRGTSFDEVAATALADVPLGRLATPTEVADAIVFLVSDQASYLSGIVLPILGGELSG